MSRPRNGRSLASVAAKRRRRPLKASAPAVTDPARVSRSPQQDRGQRRVEAILDAAEHVVAEVGVEGASTNIIAARAGASMGSLYHFFPSKEAIICALGDRYAQRMQEANAAAMPLEKVWAPLTLLFDRIVDSQQQFMQTTPAFGAVHDAIARRYGRNGAFFIHLEKAILVQIVTFLSVRLPRMPAELREASARLAYTVVHAVCESTNGLPADQRKAVLQELKDMMVRYYQPLQSLYGPVLDDTAPESAPRPTGVKRKVPK